MARRTASALLLALATAAAAHAQDVELRARPGGPRLPQAYYDRIRAQPDFFEIDRGWRAQNTLTPQPARAVSGTLPVAVVQVLWSDSPDPPFAIDAIQRVLFDGPAPHGTLTEFYREMSRGRFTVTGRVLPWVRTAITRAETVGPSFGLGGEARTGVFLLQALQAVDPLVDFGEFDNDGPDGIPNSGDDDGFADAVAFQFLERAASCDGGTGIWPHRAGLSAWGAQTGGAFVTDDRRPDGQPVRVNGYIIQSTVDCEGQLLTASVIAHELGHVLGLPDLYHAASGLLPSQRRWVLGCWSLMAAGAWGCGDGSLFSTAPRPTHMGPWEKSVLGWITEQDVGAVRYQEFVLEPIQTSGRSLRLPLGPGEYLQLEYRPRIGFDAGLPAGGVLIYHIDLTRPLYPAQATDPRIYRIALQEADRDGALLRTALEGGDRGVAGDAWGLLGATAFSHASTPPLRRNSGAPATVTIHSITIDGDVARVRISTAATPALVSGPTLARAAALEDYAAELHVAGGAPPYQWTVTGLPRGLVATPAGDRLRVTGRPLEHGTFTPQLAITDATGARVTQPFALTIGIAAIAETRLLQPLLRSAAEPLLSDELTYLDGAGNANGRYDVGDLRRHLLAAPAGAQP